MTAPRDWRAEGACRTEDPALFFAPDADHPEPDDARDAREAAAKAVCARCPVIDACAAHALAVREPYGVWGGMTEDEREARLGRVRPRLASAS